MAWVKTVELIDDNTASQTKQGKTFNRVFLVQFDSKGDGAGSALIATDIPEMLSSYVFGNEVAIDAVCTNKKADRVPASTIYKVTCTYSTDVSEQEKTENPIDEPVRKRWSFRTFSTSAEKDKDGEVIKNKAGDRPGDAMKDDCRPVLTLSYNRATFDPSLAFNYCNAVNSSSFGGFAPERTAKVAGIEADEVTAVVNEAKFTYWAINVEIHFNRHTWDLSILNEGIRQKNDEGKLVPCKVNGVETSVPVPLDNDGKQLEDGEDPIFLSFKVYDERDFNAFPY